MLNGGANRGARENLRAFVGFNLASAGAEIVPVYVDPSPGRAIAMSKEAEKSGIRARAVEGRVEEALASTDVDPTAPTVFNIDRASAIASALRAMENHRRAVLAYLLLKLPSGRLMAIRLALEPEDGVSRQAAIAFFDRLAALSERNGSRAILGDGADPAHVLAEPVIRAWFAEHCQANLDKITAGVEPVSNTFEVTTNGRDTLVLHIVVRPTWSEPAELADAVVSDPAWPIRRGSQFVVAEVTDAGLRFHTVRRRTDERVTVHGADTIDRASVEARERAEALAAARAAEAKAMSVPVQTGAISRETGNSAELLALAALASAALRLAERETLSRRNPIRTTD